MRRRWQASGAAGGARAAAAEGACCDALAIAICCVWRRRQAHAPRRQELKEYGNGNLEWITASLVDDNLYKWRVQFAGPVRA